MDSAPARLLTTGCLLGCKMMRTLAFLLEASDPDSFSHSSTFANELQDNLCAIKFKSFYLTASFEILLRLRELGGAPKYFDMGQRVRTLIISRQLKLKTALSSGRGKISISLPTFIIASRYSGGIKSNFSLARSTIYY